MRGEESKLYYMYLDRGYAFQPINRNSVAHKPAIEKRLIQELGFCIHILYIFTINRKI